MDFVERRSRSWVPRARARPQPADHSAILREIGRELRGTYRDLVSEPLPEHLVCIVERLPGFDAQSRTSGNSQGGAPSRS